MTPPSRGTILIVGAGLAGLCCARHLHLAGFDVRLFDRSEKVGGRVRTDLVDGFRLDRGFQVLLTAYPEARRVLDYEALRLKPFYPGAMVRADGRFHLVGDPFRRPLDLWSTLRSPVGSLADKVRMALLRSQLARRSVDGLFAGDDVPSRDWLRALGFSERMMVRFFHPFLGGVFLDRSLSTTSRMARFVLRMFADGPVTVPEAGMEAIPAQLAQGLPSSALTLEATVVSVDRHSVTLSDGRRFGGNAVVVATDAAEAVRLTDGRASPPWSGTTCLYLDAPEPPVKRPILVLNGEGRGLINNLHVVSQVNPASAPPGRALVSVTVLDSDPDPDRLFPAVRDELVSWFGPVVETWRSVQTYVIPHALPAHPPGALSPPQRPVRTESGLYLCGDHLDHASIQGAMESGRRAAEAIRQDLCEGVSH